MRILLSKYSLIIFSVLISACSVTRLPDSMGKGVLNSDDMETVKDGLPAYLLIVDGLLENYPDSESLLITASSLNGAYASVFVEDEDRKRLLVEKSLDFAFKALCSHNKKACGIRGKTVEEYRTLLSDMDKEKNLAPLFTLGSAWASYIQLNSSDWNAIAELARVDMLMQHIVSIDEGYENGMALLYLGVLNSLLPPSLGGKPEVAKTYFDKAIDVSGGRNLIVKVYYAEKYARLLFEQELHDKLLNEVIKADPHEDRLTLQNVYAQKLAKQLLAGSAEYFE